MTALKSYGLLPDPGGVNGPMLRPETPPVSNPGGPFADDLDRCDIMMGVPPRPRPSIPKRPPRVIPPDPTLPLSPRSFVGPRIGYGAQLAPLTFTIRGAEYAAKADLVRRTTMDAIFRAVEASFVAKRVDLVSPRRDRAATQPRFAVCLLAVEFTDWSLPRIGRALGGRDHTTILNAIHRARVFEQQDRVFAAALGQARAALSAQLSPGQEAKP